jgi:hypothetical protein
MVVVEAVKETAAAIECVWLEEEDSFYYIVTTSLCQLVDLIVL